MKLLVAISLLIACAGSQRAYNRDNPTCTDAVEHGFALATEGLAGNDAFAARREFVRIRPKLVEACEQANVPLAEKQCIMRADSMRAADACGPQVVVR
jgi:hypothetical protein